MERGGWEEKVQGQKERHHLGAIIYFFKIVVFWNKAGESGTI